MFGQLAEIKQYLKRVKDKGGTIRSDVQVELNNFTKRIYKEGLRSTNGGSHAIKYCNVFPTETKAGSNVNLWFTNQSEFAETGYNYSVEYGAIVFDEIDTGFTTSQTSLNDGHLSCYLSRPYQDLALIGYGGTTTNRMMIHPNGYGGFYMDFGNTTDGRSLYNIGLEQRELSAGLEIATKSNSNARHILNGTVVNTVTLATNLFVSTGNFVVRAYNASNTRRNLVLGGLSFGADIPNNKLSALKDAWDSLQQTINVKRVPSYIPSVPEPDIWLDASDASTLIDEFGNQVSSGGEIRSWYDKSVNRRRIFTRFSDEKIQHFSSYSGVRFVNGGSAGCFYHAEGLYFGTLAFVITPDDNLSNANNQKVLLGHFVSGASTFNAFGFGEKTGLFNGVEFAWMIWTNSGRLALNGSQLNISPGERAVVILSRTGTNTGLGKLNNTSVPVIDRTDETPLNYIADTAFSLGRDSSFTSTTQFRGYLHEFRNIYSPLTQTQINNLAQELTTKWSI